MTPFVRGRILAEIETTGHTKHTLDVLVWLPQLTAGDIMILGDVCILKQYLGSLVPCVCDICFHIPVRFSAAASVLARFDVPFSSVQVADVTDAERAAFKAGAPPGLLESSATAISCDCDLMLIRESDWFPYWHELDQYNLLAVDCDILKRQCDIFVRGFDLPWSFADMTWRYPWTSFYMMVEHTTFKAGLRFLEIGQRKHLGRESMETGRMLVYNRLANLCFTQDRLLFYELQRRAAKRARWTRQKYLFEMGYYLEFYYLLIFGGLDSIAVLLNFALKLGLRPKKTAAQSQMFLKVLARKAPEIHAAFVDPAFSDFLGRVSSLRHLAAHRGSIMPGPVYEQPDVEPSPEELDEEIKRRGLEAYIELFPAGPVRDWARSNQRFKIQLEKSKKLIKDVVLVEMRGKYGFIYPMADIEWTFSKLHSFMAKVLEACLDRV